MSEWTPTKRLLPDPAILAQAVQYVWEWLVRLDEPEKARTFLECVPYVIDDAPHVTMLRDMTAKMLTHLASVDAYAEFYRDIWESDPPSTFDEVAMGMREERAVWALRRFQGEGVRSCIDFGPGSGFIAMLLARHGIAATGVNLTERCVPAATGASVALGLPARFVWARAEEYVAAAPVDAAFAFEIVEHVIDPDALVATMERNVKPGGLCLMTTPNGSTTIGVDTWEGRPEFIGAKAHVRVYTERRMTEWLGGKPGFLLTHQSGAGMGTLAVEWRRA